MIASVFLKTGPARQELRGGQSKQNKSEELKTSIMEDIKCFVSFGLRIFYWWSWLGGSNQGYNYNLFK